MALLCEGCHSRVTRKFWSKEKVKEARNAPWCVKTGHCHDAFDVGKSDFAVWIGTNKIVNVWSIIGVDDTILLSIESPEEVGAPFRLSGVFYDDNEKFLFKIVRNEWFGEATNWDIECAGGRIVIRTNQKKIALQLKCDPPDSIVIERMNMFYKNTHFFADDTRLGIKSYDGSVVLMSGRELVAKSTYTVAFNAVSQGKHKKLEGGIGALNIGAIRMFGGGEGTLASLPRPVDIPSTLKGNYVKKNWGTIKLRPAINNRD
jgi:hypothetical protein